MSQVLNAIDFPLWGSRLIEASAGTGKTWTIAALYLRLVLGHGGVATAGDPTEAAPDQGFVRPLRPADILVMTFTRAATRELSDRIRARLIEAARCFRGQAEVPAHDAFLHQLLAAYPEGPARTQAGWRLATAAEGMDDAAVHTIDAWCQRMLREHAFDSGNLFSETLMADEHALFTEAAQDYWRQHCYPLPEALLDAALSVWPDVDALVKDMASLVPQDRPASDVGGSLGDCLSSALGQRKQALARLKEGWVARAQAMQDWLQAQADLGAFPWNRAKLGPAKFPAWFDELKAWARDPELENFGLDANGKDRAWKTHLTPEGMAAALNAKAQLPELPPHFAAFAELRAGLAALPSHAPACRLHAAHHVAQRLAHLKRQAGTFGFADMQHRLVKALGGPQGERLRERMLAQYPVALIDEFQDTSPLQYRLFDLIYRTERNDRHSALLLIGDPKQSIYGFRGADIYSYLQARQATAGRHHVLGTNHRSSQAMVCAVNRYFMQAEARAGEGAFMFRGALGGVTPEANPLPFVPVQARGRAECFVSGSGSVPALCVAHDLTLRSANEHRRLYAGHCAEQIVHWLNDAHTGFAQPDGRFTRLRPADIAVLVRTGREAQAIQRALRRRGVASVYLSDKDSVLDSVEAHDLLRWLRAVASPLDARLVRAALATSTLGLDMAELHTLAHNDEAFDARSEQLRGLHSVWQSQGVLTMLRQTLHQLDLPAQWLAQPDGERRLTNVLHLAELLQAASAQLDGEQALIRWLQGQLQDARQRSEEQVVRLESDADLVKVVTVHKSKGLEYPVVCLPFACSLRKVDGARTSFVKLPDAQGVQSLHLSLDKDKLVQADRERLREDLRLLYVALTRARHTTWMGFAALKEGRGSVCLTPRSAAGYLLVGAAELPPEALWPPLQALADGDAGGDGDADGGVAVALQAMPDAVGVTPLQAREVPPELRDPQPYQADFDRRWTIGSFSSLVRALAHPVPSLLPTERLRPADDEVLPTADALDNGPAPDAVTGLSPGLASDQVNGPSSSPKLNRVPDSAGPQAPPWHRFTRGAVAGNFLHDQLEWLATEGFALGQDAAASQQLAERLRRRCERSGRGAQADDMVHWLTRLVQMPLPPVGAALQALDRVLPEMEFWLPAGRLSAAQLDAACRRHLLRQRERPALPERELHGMLMGFADLVFEHDGRFWVLDHKSNHLGDDDQAYHPDALEAAMAEHRYDVQAAIYLLALHRLLRDRLGTAYVPAQHLGGAVYLFLRGIDGPARGCYAVPPDSALLAELDAMLAEGEEGA